MRDLAGVRGDAHALAVVLAAVAALALLYGRIDYGGAFAGVDLRHYRAMAEAAPALDLARPQPFVYRVGGPWLAGVTPLADPHAFGLWALAASLALAAFFYGFVRRVEGVGPWAAALAVVLFALNPYWFGFTLFNPFQLGDLLGLLALLAAFGALAVRRWGLVALSIALGALCRESALLAVPAVLVAAAEGSMWRRELPRAVAAVAPAVAVFVGLRIEIEPAGDELLAALAIYGPKALDPETWFRLLVSSAAPLSFFPLVFWRATAAFFRERLHLLVYLGATVASCFFGHDQERLMAPAFVVLYAFVAVVLEQHFRRRPLAVGAVMAAGVVASLHHLTARYPLPSREVRVALVLAALALATAAALAVRREVSRRGSPS